MTSLDLLLENYLFINHEICKRNYVPASVDFAFYCRNIKQINQSAIKLGDKQVMIRAVFEPFAHDEKYIDLSDFRYEKMDTGIRSKVLSDVHPFKIQWEVDAERKIVQQEIAYILNEYGPDSFMSAITWGNKPHYKFWEMKVLPKELVAEFNGLITIWNSKNQIENGLSFLKLNAQFYERIKPVPLTNPKQFELEFTLNERKQRMEFIAKKKYRLPVPGGVINLISMTLVNPNEVLYMYDSLLWPERLRRNVFGGGRQIFMIDDEPKVFFISSGGELFNRVVEIKNIAVVE